MLNENILTVLNQVQNSLTKPTIVLVQGDYGSGKTVIIERYLNCQKVLRVKRAYDDNYYASLKTCLRQFGFRSLESIDDIRNCILNACNEDVIMYLDDISYIKNVSFLDFMIDIIQEITQIYYQKKIMIIIEISTNKLNEEQKSFYYKICSMQFTIIADIKKRTSAELKMIFNSRLPKGLHLSEGCVNEIISGCFYNVANLIKFAGYLSSNFNENKTYNITYKDVVDFIQGEIELRYNKLDSVLKNTIKNAAITGFTIDIELLYTPMEILQAEDNLKRIKRLSNLIISEENAYQFENNEVQYYIEHKMDDENRKGIHLMIAKFLSDKRNKFLDEKIGMHYEHAEHYSSALTYYFYALHMNYDKADYYAVKQIAHKLIELTKIIRISNYHQMVIYYYLFLSYEQLSNYDKALTYIEKLISINCDLYRAEVLQYHKGYILYNYGKTEEAESILTELRKNCTDKKLQISINNILSGIYDQLGNKLRSSRLFNEAVILSCEIGDEFSLHQLYRTYNMHYDSDVSIPKMKEAFTYFGRLKDKIEQAKAAHNLGMEYISVTDFAKAEYYIEIAIELLRPIFSHDLCFPLSAKGNLAMFFGNYVQAKECYESALGYAFDDFIKIVLYINLAFCLREQNQMSLVHEYINKAEGLLKQAVYDDLFVQKRNVCILKALLQYDQHLFTEAMAMIELAYQYETKYMRYNYYSLLLKKWYIEFADCADIKVQEDKYRNRKLRKDEQILFDRHIFVANLLFWGA